MNMNDMYIVEKTESGNLVLNYNENCKDMKRTQLNLKIHPDYLSKFDLKEGDIVSVGYGELYGYIKIFGKLINGKVCI